MPAPITREVPVTPWFLHTNVSDIPVKGIKGIEVEAIAIEKEHGGEVYCTRLVFSPEDGLLKMCSVYLREEGGGALCIADLPTKEEAFAYAAVVSQARSWQVHGSIWDLRIREVPGKGYVADPRHAEPFTLDPAKAALYHASIAKDDLFVGGPGEHGRWMAWFDASNHALDRAAEKDALVTRVFNAAVAAMGASGPVAGSLEHLRMRSMLKNVVEANRSDRLVVFDEVQRDVIHETLDAGRFELTGHEADEELCELILSASPYDLFDDMNRDFEIGLLKAFASEPGVAAIETVIATSPEVLSVAMLPDIHRRLELCHIDSPFARHFAETGTEPSSAPRG